MAELIADVAVNAPLRQLFSYRIPAELESSVAVGMRVLAPFGRRRSAGVVLRLRRGDAAALKDLHSLLDDQPVLDEALIHLLRWVAEYYHYPIGQVIKNALPGGLLSPDTQVRALVEPCYCAVSAETEPTGKRQQQLLAWIRQQGPATLTLIREQFPSPTPVLRRLVELGLLRQTQAERVRDPFHSVPVPVDFCVLLNPHQQAAVEQIGATIREGVAAGFLLHGVTGSGKTEVYLHAVKECLAAGKQALILVPEIALTPQLVARFRARFEPLGEPVAVLHSGLSAGERYDAWRGIRSFKSRIVIGARSAIFAPLTRPGLIIVDEEHDASYKQGESLRYHARDLALVRGRQQRCPVVLGSATPSLASYSRSEQGKLIRLELPQRVHAGALPQVELIDLREQRGEGLLAPVLVEGMTDVLAQRQQVLLLLNRRGFAPFLLCADCGVSFHCPNCEITLTYHQGRRQLVCHYCDYTDVVPEVCSDCGGHQILPQGAGTERLEEELRGLFPGARIARMDRDTTRGKGSHQRIVDGMMAGRVDILVGTQMIAKGHDFPDVALVGVLAADSLLNLPDFRATERCFALLTQVAGRAGRAHGGGRVYIQTYQPEHFALQCAVRQDYVDFYRKEFPFRQELDYPPSGHLINLLFTGNNVDQVRNAATAYARALMARATSVEVLGPSPCPLLRLRGKYRFQILLKAKQRPALRSLLNYLDENPPPLPRQVAIHIDVDPLDMF